MLLQRVITAVALLLVLLPTILLAPPQAWGVLSLAFAFVFDPYTRSRAGSARTRMPVYPIFPLSRVLSTCKIQEWNRRQRGPAGTGERRNGSK